MTVKALLGTDRDGLVTVAVMVLLPVWLTLNPLNVAVPVPAAVVWAPPPVRVPVPVRLMVTERLPTPLPYGSVTFTVTAGENVAPAVTDEGGP
jgi:hypothetical protein